MKDSMICRFLLMCCAVVMTLVVPVFPLTEKPLTENELYGIQNAGSSLYDAETVCFVKAGEDAYDIAYIFDEAGNSGPESFAIENGKVYLLDSANARLLVTEAGTIRSVSLAGCRYPTHMCVENDIIYVTDCDSRQIMICDKTGVISTIDLPDEISSDYVYRIHPFENGKIQMLTHDLDLYVFDPVVNSWSFEGNVTVEKESGNIYTIKAPVLRNSISIECAANTMVQYISIIGDRLFVGVYEYVPDVSIILTEHIVNAYNIDGSLIGTTVIDNDEAYSYPNDDTYISSTGELYIMHCNTDGVYITCPNLRKSYCSSMPELTARAFEAEKEIVARSSRAMQEVCAYKRPQVLSRANSAASHTWVISAANKTLYDDVILPSYVNTATPGDTLTGIPYAWGKWVKELSVFDANVSTGKTTGNIDSSTLYGVYATTGMDCAGFVSYAYGFNNRQGSGVLAGFGYYVSTTPLNTNSNSGAFSNMKSMDFIVKSGVHVLLFNSIYSSGYINIYDAVKTENNGNGYVGNRAKSISQLSGYYLKSPYSCTQTGCQYTYTNTGLKHKCTCTICGYTVNESHTYGSTYAHSDAYHYHECTKCGAQKDVAAHNFILVGAKYRCTVCGFQTTNPVYPTSIGAGSMAAK